MIFPPTIRLRQKISGALRVWKRRRQRLAESRALASILDPLSSGNLAAAIQSISNRKFAEKITSLGMDAGEIDTVLQWLARQKEVTLVCPHNQLGFVTHYHHFFGAIVLPVLEWLSVGALSPGCHLLLRDCGPMNKEMRSWAEILHINVAFVPAQMLPVLSSHPHVKYWDAPGYDYTYREDSYPRSEVVDPVRAMVFDRLDIHPGPVARDTATPKVIIIGRDQPDPFYKSSRAERNTSGAERRSIPNIQNLADMLLSLGADVRIVLLEKMRVDEKIKLFANADLVIGQMGAGLNNILWMREHSALVEICPVDSLHENFVVFSSICHRIGVEHRRIVQTYSHAPVPEDMVRAFVQFIFPKMGGIESRIP